MMTEKPILFSREMVRAILGGSKTQTRRVVKVIRDLALQGDKKPIHRWRGRAVESLCPYGQPGDRLWVRETFACAPTGFIYKASFPDDGFGSQVVDMATSEMMPLVWRPSIHMPRAACRITLDVVSVRVERLQTITRDDAKAEGVNHVWSWDETRDPDYFHRSLLNPYIANYSMLWDEIYEVRGLDWDVNPWVWVVEFKRVTDGQ